MCNIGAERSETSAEKVPVTAVARRCSIVTVQRLAQAFVGL